jgi:hypothetical protein
MVTAFISYSWDDDTHKLWVRELATQLRADGITVALDQWHAVPGDQLPEFMERSIRESQYVLIVCTPGYRQRADGRKGGVGYEGDVITGELLIQRNHRKFIPLLRSGDSDTAIPSWLIGKYFINLEGQPYSDTQYRDLLATLLGTRPEAPPVGATPASLSKGAAPPVARPDTRSEPIRITGLLADKVTTPRMDGSSGSALYEVPFRLSRRPEAEWSDFFIDAWNHPSSYTSMHRPGIADVEGTVVWLRGTTLEEVERYHRATLLLAVNQANLRIKEVMADRDTEKQRQAERERAHRNEVEERAKRIKFD